MEWKDEYDIGIIEIDTQHRNLFKMVNDIKDSMAKGVNNELIIKTAFTAIVEYTKEHFKSEEILMKKMHFPGVEMQQKQHKQLIDDIIKNLKQMKIGKKYNAIQLYSFLNKWLLSHIISEDQKLREFVFKRREAGVEI